MIKIYVTDDTVTGGILKEFSYTVKTLDKLCKFLDTLEKETEMDRSKDLIIKAIDNLAKKWKISKERTLNYLSFIDEVNEFATYSIVLKEIANVINSNYTTPIEQSKYIFAINNINGRIVELNKNDIKSYNNFAAFRTYNDARIAKIAIESIGKKLIKSEEK